MFEESNEEYHDFIFSDHEIIASDLLHLITIELPKVKEIKAEDMNAIQSWNYYFQNYEKKEKQSIIEVIKKREGGIAMADEKINQISPEQLARINQIYDERFAIEEKWRLEEALEKKFDEGMHKGLSLLINKLLVKHDLETVSTLIDMSVEEIKQIIG